jgi:hypothetical protein
MTMANLAILSKRSAQEAFGDIRQVTDKRVPDRELVSAINRAVADHGNGSGSYTPYTRPQAKPVIVDGKAARQRIIDAGKFSTEEELVANSPISIPEDPAAQQKLFLETVFQWDDFVFSGDRLQPGTDRTILPVCEWIEQGAPGPFVIINPLSGYPAPLKSGGGMSYRADGCVKVYRHALVEFDNIPLEEQFRFWSGVALPVKALIHTGNKSIHAWIDLSGMKIETPEQWQKTIKNSLYDELLKPIGVDVSCSNPARLSRLPGVYRADKEQWQRLIWIAGRGQNV